jgi:prolipoprotein diacylglyceryltransferase
MGQLLSSIMIVGGIAVATWVYRQPPQTPKPALELRSA